MISWQAPASAAETCSLGSAAGEIKMDRTWLQILVMLLLYPTAAPGAGEVAVNEGDSFEISCRPDDPSSMVIWFRVLDKAGMEFIASFDRFGKSKSQKPLPAAFSSSDVAKGVLRLNSFRGADDSGIYSCASIRNNQLKFGEVTRLTGVKVKVTTSAPLASTAGGTLPTTTTTTACVCDHSEKRGRPGLPVFCSPVILAPLAAGCGLLLLLLITTTLYCNRHGDARTITKENRRRRLPENN
ncbi:T-cell surface glycoprotein CD8 alpha chain isoform X2 [Xiphias gladius]|uniref:T-cell surface glycoprotein CD8 alpha chain isoform X2 n=1 Tax=Xiphias gladius TaxID=8245 RepID=UPI001A982BD2|nr:T-cell surface glycoprotein CD8 alpha chain isoform X2 [Xiphias gladius]XP_040015053.1 T-cell surface glycoprotein CD8 alpha chain isoform X2 [Xiphias gladius]